MQPIILKSTMNNGLIMGIIFSFNFIFSISNSVVLRLLSFVLMILIIGLMYQFEIRFRDKDCGGSISYFKSFAHLILTFFFAALISSIVKYIYFKFINPGYLQFVYTESIKAMEMLKNSDVFGKYVNEESYGNLEKMLKPATYSLQYIWVNVLVGTIISFILAAFVKKDKDIFEEQ